MNRAKDRATVNRKWLNAWNEIDGKVSLQVGNKLLANIRNIASLRIHRVREGIKNSLDKHLTSPTE